MCKLILPSVHFAGLHDSLILRTSLQRKHHSNMLCYTQKWVIFIHWCFKFWVFTFLSLSPEIKCRVALTKVFSFFFSQIFLHFGQFYLYSRHVCNKRLANWTAITDTLTLNGFARNAKHGFDSCKWSTLGNGQIWLGTSPVVLNLFYYSYTLSSAIASSQKTFVLILTLGKWKNAFDDMYLSEIFNFLLGA